MNAKPMHAICGAHCRTTGEPCKNRPMLEKMRCRMHGGKGGRPQTSGLFTNKARLATNRRGELGRLLKEVDDQLRDMARQHVDPPR